MSQELQRMNQQNKVALWAARVAKCRNSGQNVKAWCRENGVCKQTYYRRQKRFGLVGRKGVVVEMRSDGIVNAENVFKESQVEFVKRCVIVAIDNLFFEVFEKAFHNGIVARMSLGRKGLNHVKHTAIYSQHPA